MHRSPITIEQAQLRQRVNPRRQAADHATGTHQLLECAGQARRHGLGRLVSQQKQLLATFELAGPRLARQAPGTFARCFGLQERQLVDHFRMDLLGNPQHLFRQRQGQGLGAGPDEKTDSLGGHGVRSET
ncbi:hypothetical protein D3C80_1550400 [compost metagenome]